MRVTAAPFGAMAPLKPVQDDRGRVIRTADWPLTGAALVSMRVVYDTAGKVPVAGGVPVRRGQQLRPAGGEPAGPAAASPSASARARSTCPPARARTAN